MSQELRGRRLETLLGLLARAHATPAGERLEQALDALLDATPARAAAAFDRDTRSGPAAERRLEHAFTQEPSRLVPALAALAERCFSTSASVRLSDVRRDTDGIDGAEALPALGAHAALSVPILGERAPQGALVLLFADSAMLDQETLAYIDGVARLTALFLATDRAQGSDPSARSACSGVTSPPLSAESLARDLRAPVSALAVQHGEMRAVAEQLAALVGPHEATLNASVAELSELLNDMSAALGRVSSLVAQLAAGSLRDQAACDLPTDELSGEGMSAHDGQIAVGERAGGAAGFRVHPPQADKPSLRAHVLGGRGASRPPAHAQRVLLIDDDPVFARSLQRALKPHDVRIAGSAAEAEIALLDPDYEPDLVVCDVLLPGANGDVVHARVCERRPDVARRFVFVTGAGLAEAEAAYLRASGLLALRKPVDVPTLLDLLSRSREGSAAVHSLTQGALEPEY